MERNARAGTPYELTPDSRLSKLESAGKIETSSCLNTVTELSELLSSPSHF
jgi:hypothetical protein